MNNEYTHVLGSKTEDDPFIDPNLFITNTVTEDWEHFINGQWTGGDPFMPGVYIVSLRKNITQIAEAIPAKNNKHRCIWKDPQIRSKVVAHWHRPIPLHFLLKP
jgi:3-hydroxymyristoyl/3-hydroxydecanoyl-(acyl carrier protein) dehydratase